VRMKLLDGRLDLKTYRNGCKDEDCDYGKTYHGAGLRKIANE